MSTISQKSRQICQPTEFSDMGTFANILRQRVKSVSAELRDRIVQAAFHDIEQEIARLDHEKRLLESMGIGPSQDDLDAVEAALEAARSGLARMRASR